MGAEDTLADELVAEVVGDLDRAYARTSPVGPAALGDPRLRRGPLQPREDPEATRLPLSSRLRGSISGLENYAREAGQSRP